MAYQVNCTSKPQWLEEDSSGGKTAVLVPKRSGNQYFELLKVGGNAPKYSKGPVLRTKCRLEPSRCAKRRVCRSGQA